MNGETSDARKYFSRGWKERISRQLPALSFGRFARLSCELPLYRELSRSFARKDNEGKHSRCTITLQHFHVAVRRDHVVTSSSITSETSRDHTELRFSCSEKIILCTSRSRPYARTAVKRFSMAVVRPHAWRSDLDTSTVPNAGVNGLRSYIRKVTSRFGASDNALTPLLWLNKAGCIITLRFDRTERPVSLAYQESNTISLPVMYGAIRGESKFQNFGDLYSLQLHLIFTTNDRSNEMQL